MRKLSDQVNVYDMFLSRKSDSSSNLPFAGQIIGYMGTGYVGTVMFLCMFAEKYKKKCIFNM